jgi:hypothetical protein
MISRNFPEDYPCHLPLPVLSYSTGYPCKELYRRAEEPEMPEGTVL